jgi:hypothetical protein
MSNYKQLIDKWINENNDKLNDLSIYSNELYLTLKNYGNKKGFNTNFTMCEMYDYLSYKNVILRYIFDKKKQQRYYIFKSI